MKTIDPHTLFFGNCVDMDDRFSELDHFLHTVQEFLKESEKRADAGEHPTHNDGFLFSEPFPQLLHASLLVTLISFLEHETKGYAQALRSALSLEMSLSDLSGSWLERFLKYCKFVAHFQFPFDDSLLSDLKAIIEIRNCIVHHGSELEAFQKRSIIETFAKRHQLAMFTNGRLVLNHDLSIKAFGIAGCFLGDIYDTAINHFPKNHGKGDATL